jgi:hypothetical protein
MSLRKRLSICLFTIGLLLQGVVVATPANADSVLLPWPSNSPSCNAADTAGENLFGTWPNNNVWTMRRLVVDSAATVTSATALMPSNPTTKPTVIDIRANDATVGTSSWTLVGTLVQASSESTGGRYTVSYSGSVALSPGTYWIGTRGTLSGYPSQSICLTDSGGAQSPWSIDKVTAPRWYYTSNSGANYSSGTGANQFVPFISLSGSEAGASGGGAVPSPVMQQFGKPGAGSCDENASAHLNWSGVASGNWTQSWAMWPNGGTGGSVCNRVLWFDSNSSRWSSALR